MHIKFSFVEKRQGVTIVQEYDKKFLYPMLVKCHKHLHPLIESKMNVLDHGVFD